MTRDQPKGAENPLANQLRDAAERARLTAHAIAKGSGLDIRAAQRFLDGSKDLTLASASKLAELLGLHLAERKRGRRPD
ncbi:MAG: hypothetical protein INR70_06615 [Parafilimonas terrae]|nr:hypothetical protein [Parafilimonas terrae]